MDGEKEKSEHVVTIHAVLPALAMTEESPASLARKSVEFNQLENGEAVDAKGNTPRAIKVQYEGMKLLQDLEAVRRLQRMGSDEESPKTPVSPAPKTGQRRGQHQRLPSQSMMSNTAISEVDDPYEEDDDEDYTEATLRTVDSELGSGASRKDNKMSIDGVESENPYPLYADPVDEGSWLLFTLTFILALALGIVAVIGSCIFHRSMSKKGWMGVLFGLLNKIVFAFVV